MSHEPCESIEDLLSPHSPVTVAVKTNNNSPINNQNVKSLTNSKFLNIETIVEIL